LKRAETYLPSIHPKPDDILRFLVRHDFVGADTHLISFLPEFESNATTVFGVRQGPSGTQRIFDVSTLNQAFAGLIAVVGPFQDPHEVRNLAAMARFIQLVPTIMSGQTLSEAKLIGTLWQSHTEQFNDWIVGTSMPDTPPPLVDEILLSPSFVTLSKQEATRAQVARLVFAQDTAPPIAGTPRGAAPDAAGGSSSRASGSGGKKRKEPPRSAASSQLTTAGSAAFREWGQATGKYCHSLRVPKSTRSPCFSHMCTQDSAGVKCKEGASCKYLHTRPTLQEPGLAQALYDAVWATMSSRSDLPFPR
jgi:hypothetical protein